MIPPHRMPHEHDPNAHLSPLGLALCVASALIVMFVAAALLLY